MRKLTIVDDQIQFVIEHLDLVANHERSKWESFTRALDEYAKEERVDLPEPYVPLGVHVVILRSLSTEASKRAREGSERLREAITDAATQRAASYRPMGSRGSAIAKVLDACATTFGLLRPVIYDLNRMEESFGLMVLEHRKDLVDAVARCCAGGPTLVLWDNCLFPDRDGPEGLMFTAPIAAEVADKIAGNGSRLILMTSLVEDRFWEGEPVPKALARLQQARVTYLERDQAIRTSLSRLPLPPGDAEVLVLGTFAGETELASKCDVRTCERIWIGHVSPEDPEQVHRLQGSSVSDRVCVSAALVPAAEFREYCEADADLGWQFDLSTGVLRRRAPQGVMELKVDGWKQRITFASAALGLLSHRKRQVWLRALQQQVGRDKEYAPNAPFADLDSLRQKLRAEPWAPDPISQHLEWDSSVGSVVVFVSRLAPTEPPLVRAT